MPGHEIVGKILQLGGSVRHLKEGDLVGVGWHKSACMDCDACVTGDTKCGPPLAAQRPLQVLHAMHITGKLL